MKKLLVMGANPETVSLILKAKEMGYYTIVTDYDTNAYAKQFADEPADVNAIDVDALVELAIKKQVDGVVVGVAESLLPAYCEVCERLGFPAYSTKDKFEIMIRKDYFKEKCREYGVPTIREYDPKDPNSVVFPAIVKPVDSCSSKGIRVVSNRAELDEAIEYALQFSNSGKYLIEEYMVGDEVISYYAIQDGNPIFVGMCDRYTYKEKSCLVQLPNSYIFPSIYTDSYIQHSDPAIKAMLKGLGLDNGSIFFQCFVDGNGIIRTYEPGYRLNGAQEHIIISKVSGIDVKEMYINMAIKGKVADVDLTHLANPKPSQLACKLSPLVRIGKIAEIKGLDKIAKLPGVVSVNPSYRVGDTVSGEGTIKQIICRVFIICDDKESLLKTIQEVESLLTVKDESGNEMIIGQFDPKILLKRY